MSFAPRPGQTILFTGDSITDCGRRGHAAPLGDGYVRMANDLIAARYPARGCLVTNTGIGGNTVRDLFNRWTDDVIRHRPDWLSVKIGINDVHRFLAKTPEAVSPEEFADLYDAVLTRTREETTAKLILVDPFYISTDRKTDSWRSLVLKWLPKYQKTVKAMAAKYGARHVRTHEMFQKQLKHNASDRFAPEPVHPNPSGHLLIAHAWLQEMGW